MTLHPPLPAPAEPLLPGSVDDHLVTAVPLCLPDSTAREVQALLLGREYASAADVAVYELLEDRGHRLVGLIPVERALAAPADARARDLMDPDPPVVTPGVDQEQAAWKAARHGHSSLAVVDARGAFRGLVPPARLLTVMLTEHDEDLARLGGYLQSSASARHALDEPIRTRLWHRLPWLALGLLGSAVAAVLVDGFEAALTAEVRLAFFIPGIVYMAAAVGAQTQVLVIRGLSVGVPVRRVFGTESLTGLVIGVALGALTLPVVWGVTGSADLAATVSLALVASCAVATVVALALPWVLARFGRDPAFGSGPLGTVVQDLLSLLIYFAIAAAVLG